MQIYRIEEIQSRYIMTKKKRKNNNQIKKMYPEKYAGVWSRYYIWPDITFGDFPNRNKKISRKNKNH